MAVITYTDTFGRSNVTKLSLDPTLWTGVTDGKCLSIRSNKLLATWQDILDGFHNPDTAVCAPTNMPLSHEAYYTERQAGSMTFSARTHVSMDATDPASVVYTDNFSGGVAILDATKWDQNDVSGTWDWTRSATNTLRGHETFLGSNSSWADTKQMSACLNQYSQLTYKSGTPIDIGPSVRSQGIANVSSRYILAISASSWRVRLGTSTNGSGTLPGLSGSLTLAADDVFKISAVDDALGVQITAYQNGAVLGTAHFTFAGGSYVGSGLPGFAKDITTAGTMDVHFDDWQGGGVALPAANPSSVSTEINFYHGLYGVGYADVEDGPSAGTYTPIVYIFTDGAYDETPITLTVGNVLSAEVEIVDSLTCNVVAYVNDVEVLRIDGADRQYGRPYITGTGTSPEQEHYVDGLQARSELVWSAVTLEVETLVPVNDETLRTTLATCVRTKQPAWGKWKFSGNLRGYSILDNLLVLSIERSDIIFVETIDLSPVPQTRFLDCEVLTTDMAVPTLETGVTTWTLPFDIPVDSEHPMAVVNTDTGELIETLPRSFYSQISATGNFLSANVAIGLLFPTEWELGTIFYTDAQPDGSTVGLADGKLQLRHLEFNFSRTGGFTVTVIPNTDDPSQSYEYTFDGDSDDEEGAFRAPVLGQNTKVRITVGGTSHRPFAISNYSWTGNISQLTKRV